MPKEPCVRALRLPLRNGLSCFAVIVVGVLLLEFQDRNEDVDSVARQLKQLEELVQELEEGLEDARRGEAEARGEVEFLRGEVERGRSELKREREKAAAAAQNGGNRSSQSSLTKDIEQRDDEIRGLKAIIHSLSRNSMPDGADATRPPTNGSIDRMQRTSAEIKSKAATDKLERELNELRAVVELKTSREEELERVIEDLRRGSVSAGRFDGQRASNATISSMGTVIQDRASPRQSKTSWRDKELPLSPKKPSESGPESDTYSSAAESTTPYCEICETSGHDILTCTSMFSSKQGGNGAGATARSDFNERQDSLPEYQQRTGKDAVLRAFSPKDSHDQFKPPPLKPRKSSTALSTTANSQRTGGASASLQPDFTGSGPVAGKESGVVNADKWCALCERDGHDSVDCPFEDI